MEKTLSLMERELVACLKQREQEQASRISALEAEVKELKADLKALTAWQTKMMPSLLYLSQISTPESSLPD